MKCFLQKLEIYSQNTHYIHARLSANSFLPIDLDIKI